jgi:hypothetical protein
MKIISLDVRGVGGAHKKVAFKRCFVNYKPILVQETICEGSKADEIISSCLKDYLFFSLDVECRSRGLVIRWNNSMELIVKQFFPHSMHLVLIAFHFPLQTQVPLLFIPE